MILVDTDVLVAHLRGRDDAKGWLRDTRAAGHDLAVSAVTVTEIVGGLRSGEKPPVVRLLDSLRCLPVGEAEARRAGELRRRFRRSHGAIGLGDYLVAATAQVAQCPLATLNVRHFPMFDGLRAPF